MARACLPSPLPREDTDGGHLPAATPGPSRKGGWHLNLGFTPPRAASHKGLWFEPPGLWYFLTAARAGLDPLGAW